MLRPKRGSNQKFGYVDSSNSDIWVIRPMYFSAGKFIKKYSVALCEISENHFILIDHENRNITGETYSRVSEIKLGRVIVQAKKCKVINLVTKKSEYGEFDYLSYIENDGHIDSCINDKYGAINVITGKQIPCEYDSLIHFNGGEYGSTTKGKGHGAIDWNNEVIIPFEYSSLEIYCTRAIASKDDLYGILKIRRYPKEGEDKFTILYNFEYKRISVIGNKIYFEKTTEISLDKLTTTGEDAYGL